MHVSIWQLFDIHLRDQSINSFMQVRDALIASSDYKPYTSDKLKIRHLVEQEQFQEALDYLLSVMGNWLLNPDAHELASYISYRLGQQDLAKLEYTVAQLCLKDILSTGDGSKDSPFLILHIDDEYDVLRYLNKKRENQTLFEADGRRYDVLTCEDSTTIWFDVTALSSCVERVRNTVRSTESWG